MEDEKVDVSIGIFAHNEEKYIQSSIDSVLKQKTKVGCIREILVISSGSTDKTNDTVRKIARKNSLVSLVVQPTRLGKAAAINLFLEKISSSVAITVSGDLKLKQGAIEEMCLPFLDDTTGMVGGRPKPINTRYSSIGKAPLIPLAIGPGSFLQ